ncbi:MAG: histidine phosphatase family protein [Mycobacteriales bacterium]
MGLRRRRRADHSADPRELQGRAADRGNTLVFGHGHLLQALSLRWVGVAAADGPLFEFGTASISRLGWKRETPVIATWNDTTHLRA